MAGTAAPALTLVTGEGAAPGEKTAVAPEIVPLAPAAAETAHLAGLSQAGARAR